MAVVNIQMDTFKTLQIDSGGLAHRSTGTWPMGPLKILFDETDPLEIAFHIRIKLIKLYGKEMKLGRLSRNRFGPNRYILHWN